MLVLRGFTGCLFIIYGQFLMFFFYLNVLQWHSNSFEVNWAEQLKVCDFDVCCFFLDVTYVIRKKLLV